MPHTGVFISARFKLQFPQTVLIVSTISQEMGCTHSRGVKNSITAHPLESSEEAVIPLTAGQKRIVRETWEIVEPHKKEIGVNAFVR